MHEIIITYLVVCLPYPCCLCIIIAIVNLNIIVTYMHMYIVTTWFMVLSVQSIHYDL